MYLRIASVFPFVRFDKVVIAYCWSMSCSIKYVNHFTHLTKCDIFVGVCLFNKTVAHFFVI